MLRCPSCREGLVKDHAGGSVFQLCRACKGALVPLPGARQTIRQDIQEQLLACVRATKLVGKRSCPRCENPMTLVTVPRGPRPIPLDVCEPCELVWFDHKEYDVLKAMYGHDADRPARPYLDRKWKWGLAVLGMPVERDRLAILSRPWLTWTLAAAITLISLLAWRMPELFFQFSLVPGLAGRFGGLTLLTSFFLHAGIMHLAGNLYFLLIFGDNVEDFLGRGRYLLLLLLATLTGDVFHIASDPGSMTPVVGASGGISGLIVFYGLQFPRARLLVLLRWFLFYPLRIQAQYALAVWFLLQLVGAWMQLQGFTNVSALGHLGGATVGFVFWLLWRNRLAVPVQPPARPAA